MLVMDICTLYNKEPFEKNVGFFNILIVNFFGTNFNPKI